MSMRIQPQTAVLLIKDEITFTRGLPSAEYLMAQVRLMEARRGYTVGELDITIDENGHYFLEV